MAQDIKYEVQFMILKSPFVIWALGIPTRELCSAARLATKRERD